MHSFMHSYIHTYIRIWGPSLCDVKKIFCVNFPCDYMASTEWVDQLGSNIYMHIRITYIPFRGGLASLVLVAAAGQGSSADFQLHPGIAGEL